MKLVEFVEPTILDEGINDKYIFKAIFLAGGPGSGKSFVGKQLTNHLGFRRIDLDKFVELGAKKQDINLQDVDYHDPQLEPIYRRSKALRIKERELYLKGRLPLLFDGTGRDYHGVTSTANYVKSFGYDIMLIFVNTDLQTAIKRNSERARSVDVDFLKNTHSDVKNNIGKFQSFFKDNMVIVDNSLSTRDDWNFAQKKIMKFVNTPVHSPKAQEWINANR